MTTVGLPDPRASAAERVGAPLLERYEAEVLGGRRIASLEDGLGVLAWARRQPAPRPARAGGVHAQPNRPVTDHERTTAAHPMPSALTFDALREMISAIEIPKHVDGGELASRYDASPSTIQRIVTALRAEERPASAGLAVLGGFELRESPLLPDGVVVERDRAGRYLRHWLLTEAR